MTTLIAQNVTGTQLGIIGGKALGPFGDKTFDGPSAINTFTNAVSALIGLLTVIAALWFLIQVILGGIGWMTAAGDKGKLTEARDRLSNAFVGLIIVVASWAILALAGQFFGWDTILLPASVIDKIKFQ